jgi:uncharacterized protein
MKSYNKPLPKINGDNRMFWEGCKQRELRFQQCARCGFIRWPAAVLCAKCHSSETKCFISTGAGKIYTFAVYHAPVHPAFAADVPYVVAVVALDDGPHLLTNIVGCRPEEVTIDMRVQPAWEEVTEGIPLPKYKAL